MLRLKSFCNLLSIRLSRRALVCLFVVFAFSFHVTEAQSQKENATQKKQDETVRLETRLVTTDVIVKDKKGKYITDLKAGDFSVFENGVAQKIEFFEPPLSAGGETPRPRTSDQTTPDYEPIINTISLVLDGATTDLINFKQVREGTLKYIQERITDTDAVAVFGIGTDLRLLQSFTHDKSKLVAAVEKGAILPVSNKNLERGQAAEAITELRTELTNLGEASSSVAATGPSAGLAGAVQGSAVFSAMMANRALKQFTLLRAQL